MENASLLQFHSRGRLLPNRRVLLIYTGGTIGMKENPHTGSLAPFDFSAIEEEVPEVAKFQFTIEVKTLSPPIDSSDITPTFWNRLADCLVEHYAAYDGFVILHGTDTMAYTASALSLMLPQLGKPVIITGSQLPIGAIRTDGKENLLGAIEIAATSRWSGEGAMVPEVCIFFNDRLLRGNRAKKIGAQRFDAFHSYNWPALATAGMVIRYNPRAIRNVPSAPWEERRNFCTQIATVRLFPGIEEAYFQMLLAAPWVKGIILETYGAGNAPSEDWLLHAVEKAVQRGVMVVNNTQCAADGVVMGAYDTGLGLTQAGALSAGDMTLEASLVKLMLALGEYPHSVEEASAYFSRSVAGELSEE